MSSLLSGFLGSLLLWCGLFGWGFLGGDLLWSSLLDSGFLWGLGDLLGGSFLGFWCGYEIKELVRVLVVYNIC